MGKTIQRIAKETIILDNSIRYHIHSHYSNADGYYDSSSKVEDYIALAKKNGHKAIAFSEHGNIYDWVKKKQLCDKSELKYIHGVEMYMCINFEDNDRGTHIGLYAKNFDGVKELNILLSQSYLRGTNKDKTDRHFYYRPRISLDEICETSDNIIITTACLQSPLRVWGVEKDLQLTEEQLIEPKKFLEEAYIKFPMECEVAIDEDKEHLAQMESDMQQSEELCTKLEEDLVKLTHKSQAYVKFVTFLSKNKHRVFLEIQYHNCDDQKDLNLRLVRLSEELDIPLIVGTDTHSTNQYIAKCREIVQKAKKSFYGGEDEFDLTWKNDDEIIDMFKKQGILDDNVVRTALSNTIIMSDMVEEFKLDKTFKYPNMYGEDVSEKFKDYIRIRFEEHKKRGSIDTTRINEYTTQLKEEFVAFKKQGMESYLMFMSELLEWCIKNNIPYGDRGSVTGSLIAYIINITDTDPIIENTVFSRFCNEDRVSLGDIDCDFAPEDRVHVFNYIVKRFGQYKTARIITFGRSQTRGTIDLLTRGLEYDDLDKVADIKREYDEIFNSYSKIIQAEVNLEEGGLNITFDNHDIFVERVRNAQALTSIKRLRTQFEALKSENQDLFYYFDGINGTIDHKGIHPAGIVGSPITLNDNLGTIEYIKKGETLTVTSCSMKIIDGLNFTKFDILGLKTLGMLKDCYTYRDAPWEYSYQIDWDDQNIWKDMLKTNVGIFQFEKINTFNQLAQFKPTEINHMSMMSAAIRPSGKSYRDNLINGKINKTPSDEIAQLLEKNRGFLIFQEDTIKFLTDICGFTGGEADTTRRAIGKKDKKLLKEQLPKILNGYCSNSKEPREVAEQQANEFIQIISDSAEYQFGFNHSNGYSKAGYRCARERYFHPLEFCCAYMNRAEDEEDINNTAVLAKALSISIHNIRFRYAKAGYFIDKDTNSIYKGISSIKYLSEKMADELFVLRDNTYNNFMELLHDIKDTSVNSRQLKILTELDFFTEFGNSRELINITDMFNYFKKGDMNSIREAKLIESPYESLIRDNSSNIGKNGDKIQTHTLNDINYIMNSALAHIKTSGIEDFSIIDKIGFHQKYIGYVSLKTGLESDRRKLFVKAVMPIMSKKGKGQIGYSVITRSIGSGIETRFTVWNDTFKCFGSITQGMVIECKDYTRKGIYFTMTSYNIID